MNLIAIPALSDNYIWMLHNGHQALVVDPGDATPVISTLQACQLELAAILVTHHHADHTAGIAVLRPYLAGEVWGPAKEAVPQPYQPVHEGQHLHLLGLDLEVYDIPGHTAGHIAFYIPAPQDALQENQAPIVFSVIRYFLPVAGAYLKARLNRCCIRWINWLHCLSKPVFAVRMNIPYRTCVLRRW